MSRLTIDSATLAKLQGFSAPVGLCDEQGRIVGHFVPSAALEPDIPEAELDRRAENFQGRPVEAIFAKWDRLKRIIESTGKRRR